MNKVKQSDGYKSASFKGIPIAIEWHPDGSVTLCKEVVDHIRETGDTSYLIPPPPGQLFMMNNLPLRREGTLHDPS